MHLIDHGRKKIEKCEKKYKEHFCNIMQILACEIKDEKLQQAKE